MCGFGVLQAQHDDHGHPERDARNDPQKPPGGQSQDSNGFKIVSKGMFGVTARESARRSEGVTIQG